ncbi:MAG: hypothetical protein HKN27_01795 [Silicimonas sp.]|nr:hypothetical protein [Silicimonas sp.]
MTQVWLGTSETLGFRDLIVQYIDPFFAPVAEDETPTAKLQNSFGAAPIDPGMFEVYDDANGQLNAQAVLQRLPFDLPIEALSPVDWTKTKSFFFVVNDAQPSKQSDTGVTLIAVKTVSFNWK